MTQPIILLYIKSKQKQLKGKAHTHIYDIYTMSSLDLVATFPHQSLLDGLTVLEPIDENLLDKCIHSDLNASPTIL